MQEVTNEAATGLPLSVIYILLLLGGAVLVFIIKSVLSYIRSKKDAMYYEEMRAKREEKRIRKEKRITFAYSTFSKIPLLKKYMGRLERSYLNMCPYDSVYLMKLVAETVLSTFLIGGIGVMVILIFNLVLEKHISLYSIGCCLLAVYATSIECTNFRLRKTGKLITEEIVRYISAVKREFAFGKDMPFAISQAAEGMGHEMNRLALKLNELLTGTRREDKVREYALSPTTNKDIKLFLQQAYEVSENGDIVSEEQGSVLAKNLEFLRIEMRREMLNKDRRMFQLSGYVFVCLFPVFFMTVLKLACIKLAPEMKNFYEGSGNFIVLVSFLTTIVVYDAINRTKEVVFQRTSSSSGKLDQLPPHHILQKIMALIEKKDRPIYAKIKKMLRETGGRQSFGAFVLTMLIYAVVTMTATTLFFTAIHAQNKRQILAEVTNIEEVAPVATKALRDNMCIHIIDLTKEYLHAENVTEDELQEAFSMRLYVPNREIRKNVAKEVLSRIAAYHNEYLKWYEFYIAVFFGFISSLFPYIGLKYRYTFIQKGKDDEIRQFQAIIIMERLFPNITCLEILEEMENFAMVFKPSLQKCINSYSAGPLSALYELREAERSSEEFCDLVDAFIAVEKVGVATAFAEVANNRDIMREIKDLDEEKQLSRKKDWTDMMSLIPAVMVVGVYFVLPFAINVIVKVFEMFRTFDTLN